MEQRYDHHRTPSPGVSPVEVKDCMEELLKFTVAASIDGTPGFDIGLSKEYCSNLLKDDPGSPNPNTSGTGVPTYPLYKHLAAALYESVSSGTFKRPYDKMAWIHEDSSLKQKEDEWIELVMEKGSELVNVLKDVDFELHVQEPFFSQLKDGLKTVEGRCAVGDYNRIVSGALILFNKCLVLQVQDVHRYASFSEMLAAESLTKVLPGVKTIEDGVQIYQKFYSKEKERLNGVLAVCVTQPAAQPYISLASMLSELSYGGVQRLLGLEHTVGTSVEALPPPRSTLLSSFLLPHNPNVLPGLMEPGPWLSMSTGAAVNIGALLVEVNLHIVPPHGVVYEIRIADGYGARWSEDGTKFIGFLEPYMEDGHSKRWKH